jgi:hypothetical protein
LHPLLSNTLTCHPATTLQLLWIITCSHVTMTPDHQRSTYCSTPGHLSGMDVPSDTFPCTASAWKRAAYIISHLQLGLSSNPSIIITQIAMLTGLALSLVDLMSSFISR